MPSFTVHKSKSVLVPGADVLGYSIEERAVFWPLLFRASSADQWRNEHGAFFDSFHPVKTGTWTVGIGRDKRSLDLRGEFDGAHIFDRDPFLSHRALIGLELEAPRPLWRGAALTQRFENAAGTPFIDPIDGAPPFHISNGSTFSTAVVTNPGDEPAYPTHTLEGPLDDVQIGFGESLIEVPFPIADGETLVIDTDPASRFAMLDGVDVTRELGFQMFAPVPAKGTSSLIIVATGAGAVTVSTTPLYWRAF